MQSNGLSQHTFNDSPSDSRTMKVFRFSQKSSVSLVSLFVELPSCSVDQRRTPQQRECGEMRDADLVEAAVLCVRECVWVRTVQSVSIFSL